MRERVLKDGKVLSIDRAWPAEALAMIEYLETVTGETEMLAAGQGEMGLTLQGEEAYIEGMAEADNSALLRGMVEGEIVSVASLDGGGRPRIRHTAELGISVRKAFWGLGVGDAMMAALLDDAEECGVLHSIYLGVRADNRTAFKLYQKHGFRACGLRRDYLHIGSAYQDELLMELLLPRA
ncbi:GNAT family N-acetyltransferase [Ruminococcaceae bacterium OttesenSCG-928-I18]|nr:GNAT family N-acetyltransferase [Ruminococcaceae bacterium OttesenSCG-928-I18]